MYHATQCQVEHAFSCDYAAHCQRFILRNFTPDVFFPNLLTRSQKELDAVGGVHCYGAGFPCKAWDPQLLMGPDHKPCFVHTMLWTVLPFARCHPRFSSLRYRTRLLNDREARQFWAVRDTGMGLVVCGSQNVSL